MNIDTIKLPTAKILTPPQSREINTKSGKKEVWFQGVQVECEQFRINIDMDIDHPSDAREVNSVWDWNCIADLVPGAFSSVDLARRMTLLPQNTTSAKRAA